MLIQILMSTYNGEKYLAEQLDSLLSQTIAEKEGWEMQILIRDDGSGDKTCDILQNYAKKDSRIRYFASDNKGVIQSFFDLIDMSEKDADYLAFCDQDDVWMPEKLERAVTKLTERGKAANADKPFAIADKSLANADKPSANADKPAADMPLLYCGRPLLTDSSLNPIDTVWLGGNLRPSFGNALVENICVGCTCVINHALADLLRLGRPSFTTMHDRWFYLVASCFGEVIYDTKAQIYYRQHGGNAVGMKKNHFQELAQRMQSYRRKRGSNMRQAQAFLDFCTDHSLAIPKPQKILVKDMANMKKYPKARWRLLKNKAIYRQRKGDDLAFKLLILLGRS